MKTFVVFASCLALTSVAGRGNGSGGGGSGGYSDAGLSSGGSSGSGGYSGGGGVSGGSSFGLGLGGGSSGQFGSSGLTMSALMNLLGGGGGYSQNSNGGGQGAGGYSQNSNGGGGFGRQTGSGGGFGGGQAPVAAAPAGGGGGYSGGAGGDNGGAQQGGQIRRFVSVHVAPQDDAPREARVIRAGGAPDTHVNIIFVKAPSGASEQQTEVVLPEPPKQKTLVYVLIKRPSEGEDNVKIRAPAPTKPSKPEVYFIRYKPESDPLAGTGIGGGASGDGSGLGNAFGGFPSGGGNNALSGNALGASYGAPPQQQQSGGSSGAGGYQ